MKKLKEIKNNELYYNGYSLTSLARQYGTPLKITFLDVIKDKIVGLKDVFDKAIKELNYQGKFIYLNANKANYGKEEILEALKYSDGLETSSFYDLLLTSKLINKQKKVIYSNGYKPDDYLNEIINAHNNGFDIVDIIDSIDEYERLKMANINLKVGLRIHLKALYAEDDVVLNDRFGLTDKEIDYILNDIKNTKLVLTTIHYHQRGFDYEEDKFIINYKIALNHYIKAARIVDTIDTLDMGGGTPLPIEEGFDYNKWAHDVLSFTKKYLNDANIKEPNIICENGKYSQKDSTVNIYKVITTKNTDNIPWGIVDGSLLIAMPEMYALGEPIEVRPINNLDKPMLKYRLAGVTCDCDDIYYYKDKGYFLLPDAADNYIGLIGTGSYQNSMNGKGGVHHCLLPEEKDLVIYTKDNKTCIEIRHELQTIEDIEKLLKI